MSRESKILSAVLVVVVGAMIGLFALANRSDTAEQKTGDASKIVRDSTHKTGTGPVQLVEFGDYQCPACGAAHPIVKQILKDYEGKVTFYFRNYPLTNIHRNAQASALAAEAAADQGKFWEMHDLLYDKQKEWENLTTDNARKKFVEYATGLGMDGARLEKAITEAQFEDIIAQDLADGTALAVNSTPTFYVNGTKFAGGSNYPALREAIDVELAKAAAAPATSPAASTSPAAAPTPAP